MRFSTLTKRPLGVKLQLGYLWGAGSSKVKFEKGEKLAQKSHRVESRGFKSWKWEFNFSSWDSHPRECGLVGFGLGKG